MKCQTFVLDGDNVRHGLCGGLGFSEDDRKENIRRIGETAKPFVEAGVITLTAFPFSVGRLRARQLFESEDFIEVYCSCPLEICESRDAKGIYQRARAGVVRDFTGISSPYKERQNQNSSWILAGSTPLDRCVDQVISYLHKHGIIPARQ